MNLRERIRALLTGRQTRDPLAPRHDRREAARLNHRETGDSPWTADDRHPNADGERWVADVAPGTLGHYGSVHSTKED